MIHLWLYISKDGLQSERLQCAQEGKDLISLEDEFKMVEALTLTDLVTSLRRSACGVVSSGSKGLKMIEI